MADLILPLRAESFNAIKAGTKVEEFRRRTRYRRQRIEGKTFDRVVPEATQIDQSLPA